MPAFALAGCSGVQAANGLAQPPVGTEAAIETATTTATLIPPTPTATVTLTATVTATATASATPTPTPTLHPLTIDWLRSQDYSGSDITFEETLEPGANYNRYITSYQSEGLQIFALLTVPFGEAPQTGWPVVVFNHGYIPPDQYRTTERYVAYVDTFARSGYIVFRSDYRGHGNSEGVARGGYGAPDYTIDILNAVASIKQYPDADPGRIGMWGHSMGGYITLRTMVASPDIKAGVIWGGVVASYPDLFSRWRRPETDGPTPTLDPDSRRGRWRLEIFETYGTPEENPEFWDSLSANSYLSEVSGPIQLHHAIDDQSVPFEFSESLRDQLEAASQPVELYLYSDDNHNISVNFSTAMLHSLQFLSEHLTSSGSS